MLHSNGGHQVDYIEGWRVIELANHILGFNGWSSTIVDLSKDFIEEASPGRYSCGYSAIVRITLKDGCHHEDVGYGEGLKQNGRGAAIEMAKKSAVTDAMKRCLRLFGNALGNSIYDKEHCKVEKKVNKGSKGVVANEYVGNTFHSYGPDGSVAITTRGPTVIKKASEGEIMTTVHTDALIPPLNCNSISSSTIDSCVSPPPDLKGNTVINNINTIEITSNDCLYKIHAKPNLPQRASIKPTVSDKENTKHHSTNNNSSLHSSGLMTLFSQEDEDYDLLIEVCDQAATSKRQKLS